MKILHIADERWDSGLTHYAVALAQAQKNAGHQVWVMAKPGSPAETQCRASKLPVVQGSWSDLFRLRGWAAIQRIQILNAHTGTGHALALGVAWGRPMAVVRTRGDVRPPKRTLLARAVQSRTHAVIAAADFLRRQCAEAFPETVSHIAVVPGGVDPGQFPVTPLPEKKTIGILGRLDPVKGHADFLKAASIVAQKYPDAHFLVAGGEANVSRRELEEQARGLGLQNVSFLGRVPDAAAFMASCRLGVIASRGSEAVSRALLEWMASGRTVVATRVGCIPEVVQDMVTGLLCEPANPQDMAEKILWALSEPGRTEQMAGGARAWVEKRFTMNQMVQRTDRIYEQALSHLASGH